MKKILFIAVLATALVLGAAGIAMANYGPHGGYLVDTDACAGCHRAHTSMNNLTWSDSGGDSHSALLVSNATTMMDFCYACHGNNAPGAATNVQGGVLDTAILGDSQALQAGLPLGGEVGKPLNGGGFSTLGFGNIGVVKRRYGGSNDVTVTQRAATSQHDVDGSGTWYTTGSTIWGSWGPGTSNGPGARLDLTCTNCHDPHGSSNYRILNDAVQGRAVGGYMGDFKSSVDPTPTPWIISNEIGYPNGVGGADLGFRLHKSYWHYDGPAALYPADYMPDYTNAAYAIPVGGVLNGAPNTKGMTGWCTRACHDQYLVKTGNLRNPSATSYGTLSTDGAQSTYDAGDDAGFKTRHRHPMNVPLSIFDGDRALILKAEQWTDWDPSTKWIDLPLLHRPALEDQGSEYNTGTKDGSSQSYTLADGLDCLTCHRAHGTDAWMSGYANSESNVTPSRDSGIMGTQPTNDSALLRANDRGVCERCHNK